MILYYGKPIIGEVHAHSQGKRIAQLLHRRQIVKNTLMLAFGKMMHAFTKVLYLMTLPSLANSWLVQVASRGAQIRAIVVAVMLHAIATTE